MNEAAHLHQPLEHYPCALCGQDGVHTFDGVPLCVKCNMQVLHRYSKFQKQLEQMLVVLRSSFRDALVQGVLP